MDTCYAEGTVEELRGDKLFIRLSPAGACSGCAASLLCSSGKGRLITAALPDGSSYKAGDSIKIQTFHKKPLLIMGILMLISILSGIAGAVISRQLGFSDITCATVFLIWVFCSGLAALYIFSRKGQTFYIKILPKTSVQKP